MGWDRRPDDQLISLAQETGYRLLITADQDIRHQQNLAAISMAVIVLIPNDRRLLRRQVDDIVAAVNAIGPGEYREVAVA